MDIIPLGKRPTRRANPNWFTGRVWQTPVCTAAEPGRTRATQVSFEPGSRTAWHSHPLGQILLIQFGVGLIGHRNSHSHLVRAGDSVWIPSGEEHWQGATLGSQLDVLEILEAESGYVTTWMEHVSDEEYAVEYKPQTPLS